MSVPQQRPPLVESGPGCWLSVALAVGTVLVAKAVGYALAVTR